MAFALLDEARTYFEVLQEDGVPAKKALAAVAPMLPEGFDFAAWLDARQNGDNNDER
ncbi:hypothetical protein ACFCZT_07855 [Streptomyces sp. NPDC056230]|uniref:hypothetical protein n=1 Tax=Streptomyces sp. NPDC056230 TaxID=3345754 RepID=UPI0035DE215A